MYPFKFNYLKPSALALGLCLSPLSFADNHNGSGGGVDNFGMEDHSAVCDTQANIQKISVADFNGSGKVDQKDIKMIKKAVARYQEGKIDIYGNNKQYRAFYDIHNPQVDPNCVPIIGENLEDTVVCPTKNELTQEDIDLAISQLGQSSTQLDQEIAALYAYASKFKKPADAVKAGFVPFTQEYQNHGIHLIRFPDYNSSGFTANGFQFPAYDPTQPISLFNLPIDPTTNVLDGKFEFAKPEGLNYDRYGNLVGVFYYVGPDITRMMQEQFSTGQSPHAFNWLAGNWSALTDPSNPGYQPYLDLDANNRPKGFTGHQDHWHFHQGVCQRNVWSVFAGTQQLKAQANLSTQAIFNLASLIDTRQCDLAQPCGSYQQFGQSGMPDSFYMPKFFMLHAWLFASNNRCGAMWGTNENISYNDLLPGVSQDSIASENASYVIQGTGSSNTYRQMCLDPNFVGGMPTYEAAKTALQQSGANDVLICPPSTVGTQDAGCIPHPND
jgi:hypothetical protein